MPQYKEGLVVLTQGSNVVTGIGTNFLAYVTDTSLFICDRLSTSIPIQSVDSNTQITLASNFALTSSPPGGEAYAIFVDVTTRGYPLLSRGDTRPEEAHNVLTRRFDEFEDDLDRVVSRMPTLTDMLSTDLQPSIRIQLDGYYSTGDGANPLFDIRSTGVANGLTVYQLNNGNYAHLIVGNTFDYSHVGYLSGDGGAIRPPSDMTIPFDYAMAAGATTILLPANSPIFSQKVDLSVPANHGEVKFVSRSHLQFQYAFTFYEPVLRIYGGGNRISGTIAVDGTLMGRFFDQNKFIAGVSMYDCPHSDCFYDVKECYGFGVRIRDGSEHSTVKIKAVNCDGQHPAPGDPTRDNYGDGLYIEVTGVTVISPEITTTNGGRGGIVFESFTNIYSGTVNDPYIRGYDRNVHVEGTGFSGEVNIIGGRILDSSAGVYNFSAIPVYVTNTVFQNTTTVSVNTISSVEGYICNYLSGSKITTNNCTFLPATGGVSRVYYSNGTVESNNDDFRDGCGDADFVNCVKATINSPHGNSNSTLNITGATKFEVNGGTWTGDINTASSANGHITNLRMLPMATGFSGVILATNKNGNFKIDDVIFDNPQTYCIDNFRSASTTTIPPMFNRITAIRTDASADPTILRFSPTGTPAAHDYRSYSDSYVKNTNVVALTVIPPKTA